MPRVEKAWLGDTCGLLAGAGAGSRGACGHIGGGRMKNQKGGILKEAPAQPSPIPTLQLPWVTVPPAAPQLPEPSMVC